MTPLKTFVDHYRRLSTAWKPTLHEIADALGAVGVGR
jgi:hypothetical protein